MYSGCCQVTPSCRCTDDCHHLCNTITSFLRYSSKQPAINDHRRWDNKLIEPSRATYQKTAVACRKLILLVGNAAQRGGNLSGMNAAPCVENASLCLPLTHPPFHSRHSARQCIIKKRCSYWNTHRQGLY